MHTSGKGNAAPSSQSKSTPSKSATSPKLTARSSSEPDTGSSSNRRHVGIRESHCVLYTIRPPVNSRERRPPIPPYPRISHCAIWPHDPHLYLDFIAIGIFIVGVRSADPNHVHHPRSRVFPTKQGSHRLRAPDNIAWAG